MQAQEQKLLIGRLSHFQSNQNAKLWIYITLILVSNAFCSVSYFLPDIILVGSTEHDIYISAYGYQKALNFEY